MGLNGNRLALKVSLDMIAEAEQNQREQMLDLYEAAYDYKENYPARAKYCRDRGLALVEQVQRYAVGPCEEVRGLRGG